MKRTSLGCLLVLLCSNVAAFAQQPVFDGARWHLPSLRESWSLRRCWCPDDYGAKPLPCVRCNPKGCVDDYVCKPQPTVPCNPRGCIDDYCPKCCPIWMKVGEPWYRCVPTDLGCTEKKGACVRCRP